MRPSLFGIGLLALTSCSKAPAGVADGGGDFAVMSDGGLGAWTALMPLPAARQETAVVELGGLVYVLGGFNQQSVMVATVEAYDPGTQAWLPHASLPQALHHINAAAVGGKIYIVGALKEEGFNPFAPTGVAYAYDPLADMWSPRTAMPAGSERGASMVGVVNGIIYVAGGLRNAAVADFSSYDPVMDQWTPLPSVPANRDHGVGAAVDGVFYAIGGRASAITSHTGRVDAFDPTTNMWTSRPAMPTSRGGAAAGVVNGKIIVAGGEGNSAKPSGVFDVVEQYDPVARSWVALRPMLTPRHGTGGVGLNGVFYVPGGANVQGFGAVATVEAFTP